MITEKYTRKIWILLANSFSSVISDLPQPFWFVRWQIDFFLGSYWTSNPAVVLQHRLVQLSATALCCITAVSLLRNSCSSVFYLFPESARCTPFLVLWDSNSCLLWLGSRFLDRARIRSRIRIPGRHLSLYLSSPSMVCSQAQMVYVQLDCLSVRHWDLVGAAS